MVEILLFDEGKAKWISELGSINLRLRIMESVSPEFRKSCLILSADADDHRTTRVQEPVLEWQSAKYCELMNGTMQWTVRLQRAKYDNNLSGASRKRKRTGQRSDESAGSGCG